MGQRWPNCDPKLRTWVTHVVNRLEDVLGPNLVGTYLHGSLAGGGFYLPKSDLDLLFVCEHPLPASARRSFAHTCVEVSQDRPIVGGLECSVILQEHARSAEYPMPFEVHFCEDWVGAVKQEEVDYGQTGTDPDLAAHCQAVLEIGMELSGAPIGATFGPVVRADFVESVTSDLEWILDGDNIIESPVYAVLNSCRMLWLWEGHSRRLVPGKEEAAVWSLRKVPNRFGNVVRQALDVYRSATPVTPKERKTGGRSWDSAQLRAFRDYIIDQRAAASAS